MSLKRVASEKFKVAPQEQLGKDAVGFTYLPSFAKVARAIEAKCRKPKEEGGLAPDIWEQKSHKWSWHLGIYTYVFREIIDDYALRIQHKGDSGSCSFVQGMVKSLFHATMNKKKMFAALEAAELLQQEVQMHGSLFFSLRSRLVVFNRVEEYNGCKPMSAVDRETMQLLGVWILHFYMFFPVDFLDAKKGEYGKQYFHTSIPNEVPPFIARLKNRHKDEALKDEDGKPLEGTLSIWGCDEAWFQDDDYGTLQDFVLHSMHYLKIHGAFEHAGHATIAKAGDLNKMCNGSFMSFLNCTINELNMQISLAEQAQAKVIAQVATVAFALISIVTNYVQTLLGFMKEGDDCDC
eukprot:TRINITY_DN59663_c0_g1_i1.p1 TRINITY_DN59663_c0_g1~~TRINITY_DN59663_c0_g1_i1.p1  ORF type:complete len:350 (-),score=69.23 TRINITY_DN59663_c0_g1_i1:138-1187(-)